MFGDTKRTFRFLLKSDDFYDFDMGLDEKDKTDGK